MLIYCIENTINQKRYIGQTIQSIARRYCGDFTKYPSNQYLYHSYKKYRKEAFELTVIGHLDTVEELNLWESYYIEYYQTLTPAKGYNLVAGGKNGKHSQRQIEANRTAQNKYWSAPEARRLQSERKKRGVCSDPKHQLKMAIIQGSKEFQVYHKDTGKYVGSWTNKAECGRALGVISRASNYVGRCLRKDRHSLGNYVFCYPGEIPIWGSLLLEKIKQKASKAHANSNLRKVKCVETGIVYSSVKEAAKAIGVTSTTITGICKGRSTSAKGLTFEYASERGYDLIKGG